MDSSLPLIILWSAGVDLLFIVAPGICRVFVFGPCFEMQYLLSFSSFAIISLRRRDLHG